jgi:hypothetical protein
MKRSMRGGAVAGEKQGEAFPPVFFDVRQDQRIG